MNLIGPVSLCTNNYAEDLNRVALLASLPVAVVPLEWLYVFTSYYRRVSVTVLGY